MDPAIRALPGWLWLGTDDRPDAAGRALPFAAPWVGDQLTVVVGDAGAGPAHAVEYADLLNDLPEAERERVVVVPYGTGWRVAQPLAQLLAQRWGMPVRLSPGVPVAVGAGWRAVVTDDD